jgi:hypothetical protein
MSDEPFISRWSRRKIQAKAESNVEVVPLETGDRPLIPNAGTMVPANGISGLSPVPEVEPLPPVESLTLESDFTPFMQPGVDAGVKRRALKTLLADPRFNVMDRLDVYIDDYSKPDPLPEGWLEKMNAYARLDDWKTVDAAKEPVAAPDATQSEEPSQDEAAAVEAAVIPAIEPVDSVPEATVAPAADPPTVEERKSP